MGGGGSPPGTTGDTGDRDIGGRLWVGGGESAWDDRRCER